eukprot:TRINITY_DN125304_c0_g1_i1.p1 TRINITY_DN125304_c0_g1~~TRINITY_DN125304_c0_g1_i1.p1  ORF type:complete len:327 (-),score=56.00 TRINITY_DN125304_c0_g1_i1:212-1192(-)
MACSSFPGLLSCRALGCRPCSDDVQSPVQSANKVKQIANSPLSYGSAEDEVWFGPAGAATRAFGGTYGDSHELQADAAQIQWGQMAADAAIAAANKSRQTESISVAPLWVESEAMKPCDDELAYVQPPRFSEAEEGAADMRPTPRDCAARDGAVAAAVQQSVGEFTGASPRCGSSPLWDSLSDRDDSQPEAGAGVASFCNTTLDETDRLQQEAQARSWIAAFLKHHGYSAINGRRLRPCLGSSRLVSWKYPLHTGVKQNSAEVVRLLLWDRANPCLRNSQGQTPLDCARASDHEGSHHEVIQALLAEQQQQEQSQDSSRRTALAGG